MLLHQGAAAASAWAHCDLLCVQMIRAADPQTRPEVLEILDSAQSLGLKVLRMWAFNEGPIQYNTLQKYPGAVLWPPGFCMCVVTGLVCATSQLGGTHGSAGWAEVFA